MVRIIIVRMAIRRSTLIAIGVPLGLLLALFFGPVLWFILQTHRWESRIRRQQDPVELRTWAAGIIAAYGTDMDVRMVTNRPPAGIPETPLDQKSPF